MLKILNAPLYFLCFALIIITTHNTAKAQECNDIAPPSQTRLVKCPDGLTGNVTQQSNFICPEGYWEDWHDTSIDCDIPDAIIKALPNGLSSSYEEFSEVLENFTPSTKDTLIPAAATIDTKAPNRKIKKKCVPIKKTRGSRCPHGQTGQIIQQTDFKCPARQWSAWYNISNKCIKCTSTHKTRNLRCPSGKNGTIVQRSDYKCPARQWTGWYNVTNKCY